MYHDRPATVLKPALESRHQITLRHDETTKIPIRRLKQKFSSVEKAKATKRELLVLLETGTRIGGKPRPSLYDAKGLDELLVAAFTYSGKPAPFVDEQKAGESVKPTDSQAA